MNSVILIPGWGINRPVSVVRTPQETQEGDHTCVYCRNNGIVKFACAGQHWRGFLYMCEICPLKNIIYRPSVETIVNAATCFKASQSIKDLRIFGPINKLVLTGLAGIIGEFLCDT